MFQTLLSAHLVLILKWKKETTMESRHITDMGYGISRSLQKTSKAPEQMNLKLVPDNSSSSSFFTGRSCNIHPQIWNRCWLTQHTFIFFIYLFFLWLLNLFLVDFRHRTSKLCTTPSPPLHGKPGVLSTVDEMSHTCTESSRTDRNERRKSTLHDFIFQTAFVMYILFLKCAQR